MKLFKLISFLTGNINMQKKILHFIVPQFLSLHLMPSWIWKVFHAQRPASAYVSVVVVVVVVHVLFAELLCHSSQLHYNT